MSECSTIRRVAARLIVLTALVAASSIASVSTATAQIILPYNDLFAHSNYDYAPSMIMDGNVQHFWWCGNEGDSRDVIFYRAVHLPTGIWTQIYTVLEPTPNTWDDPFTCDPSVIRGVFYNPADANTYTFAMYYTATNDTSGFNNQIGVAFSNDGLNWVKYPYPIISPQGDASQLYGAGQASTYSADGQAGIWLFHFDNSTQAGFRVWARYASDGINFGSPTLLSDSGAPLAQNSDFAYDYNSGYFYAAIGIPWAPGARETSGFVFARMQASDLLSGQGTWEVLAQVDTSVTGAELNHSPGLLRDGYGNVTSFLPIIEAYFAWGDDDPSTWELTWAAIEL